MKHAVLAAVCSAIVAGGAGYWLGHAPQAASRTEPALQGMSPQTPVDDNPVLYYRNPMGLADTSPVPKNDSMGMAYVPVHARDAQDAGSVTIRPGRLQTLGVRTTLVEGHVALARTIRATGVVKLNERRLATVTTRSEGWVEKLDVAATGEPVKRGQVLAWIYAPELVAAEQEYLVAADLERSSHADSIHGDGSSLLDASVQRLRALDVPVDEIERLRRTGQASRRIAVRAVQDGIIEEKSVTEGMRVAAGDPLYKLADLSTVWLIADIQESDLGQIHPGQTVKASFTAFPGRTFEGQVDFIYPMLSSDTRTAKVRVVIPNRDLALRSEMFASAAIETEAAPGTVLMVPSSAVIDSGVRQVVLLDKGDGRFVPREVKLGARGDGVVQILEGLDAGDSVVTSANFLIDAESNLKAALQSFAGDAK
ncbi:MAG TPA: efflux RND transporter periplasmic adaptor subunit [Magnetospirillaceae bacterium]|nr:efflux RND transporter periplasmic adaptor subunit [Magnetospirillaceae bacterium]